MADRSRRKEKHRLKRAKKQLKARKAMSITPMMQLARSPGRLECKISAVWKEQGIASIFVFGSTSGGRHAMGVFLVDFWCVGLKDCWGKAEITRPEFSEMIADAMLQSPVKDVDAKTAKNMVAAAIRFSRQNGFKLPGGWEKWVKIFGPDFDIAHADLSDFGKDGGLLYVGTESFIRQHLIGQTLEQFMARPDVKVLINIGGADGFPGQFLDDDDLEGAEDFDGEADDEELGDEDEDEDEDEAIDELESELPQGLVETLEEARSAVLDSMRRRNAVPHPRFEDAMSAVMGITLNAMMLKRLGAEPLDAEDRRKAIEDSMQAKNEPDRAGLWKAIEQIEDVLVAEPHAIEKALSHSADGGR